MASGVSWSAGSSSARCWISLYGSVRSVPGNDPSLGMCTLIANRPPSISAAKAAGSTWRTDAGAGAVTDVFEPGAVAAVVAAEQPAVTTTSRPSVTAVNDRRTGNPLSFVALLRQ